jgi:hypothetical protein
MKRLILKSLRLAVLGLLTATAGLPAAVQAASAGSPDLEAYLSQRYYEVEFFVFERPAVVDFATEEILTLNRPRALPRAMRTQRLAPEALWTDPLDTMTRGCLTFPTLTFERLPPLDLTGDDAAVATEAFTEAESVSDDLPARALPLIEPSLEPDPQVDFLARMAEFERTLEADSQRWQAPERFRLQRAANRVERRGLGRVLFHGRWLQAVPPREAPDPILVVGGEALNAPLAGDELVGTVGVTLGRFLHFKADLFFHGPGLGLEPAGAAMDANGESLLLAAPPAKTTTGYMSLSESRRMRSEELHYLDHPKLGLVVRIDPITFPESLTEALTALEALKALEESTD